MIRGAAGSLILKFCNIGLGLVVGILLARSLGAGGYGNYAYALALIQIVSIPTVLGLPQLIIREVAAYYSLKDYGRMRGLLIRANQFVFGISALVAIVAATLSCLFEWDRVGLQTFWISLLLIPLLGLNSLRMSALRGLRHVVLGLMPEMLLRPIVFILLLGFGFFFLPYGKSPQIAMFYQVVATGTAFVIGAVLLARTLPKETKLIDAKYETRAWFKSSFPFMLLGTMQLVNSQTDIIMIGLYRSVEEVGVYRAVVQGSTLVAFVLTAVNMALAPVISGLYAEKDLKRLQRVITLSAQVVFAGTVPIVLLLILFGNWFLVSLFGVEFGIGSIALKILCIGQLFNAAMGSVGMLLNMTGHESSAAKGVTVSAILNIILNLIFIPNFGLNGAATASVISIVVWNLLLAWWVFKKIQIVSIAFPLWRTH